MTNAKKHNLEDTISAAPTEPGCYIMKNARGAIIYIGRAVNLRSRVRNYFTHSGDGRYQIRFIRKNVRSVEFIVTDSLKEAILLENTLIKQHKPKYNILLKDDKTFLSIKIDVKDKWPRLQIVRIRRAPERDGAKYFGPYTSGKACNQTYALMKKIFPLRKCAETYFRNRVRPCLYYEIKQCLGPCCDLVEPAAYRAVLDKAIKLLDGRSDEVLDDLRAEMKALADERKFEDAAVARDRIRAVEHMREKQKVVEHAAVDRDVFAYHREADEYEFQQLAIRRGVLSASANFSLGAQFLPPQEVLASFIMGFYAREGTFIPGEIFVPEDFDEREALAEALAERRGKSVAIIVPQKGDKMRMVEMARKNAEAVFREKNSESERNRRLLESIRDKLKLDNFPARIECCDISNIGGENAVGSIVAFVDGREAKHLYKRYKIKTVSGTDDYAMMREVLARRLKRMTDERSATAGEADEKWRAPDMLLVDGGKGQLNIARGVLAELGVAGVDVAAITKVRDAQTGRKSREMDVFYIPGRANPVVLRKDTAELFLLQRIRDEAHRFAIAYHKKIRGKARFATPLDAVPGIGPARRTALLKAFGSIERIARASVEQLVEVPGIKNNQAIAILKALSDR